MLTHVGLCASHGGSLLSSFQDCGDVEVRDVHMPCREKKQLNSTVDVCALSLCERLWSAQVTYTPGHMFINK